MRILLVNSFFPPLTTGSAHFSIDVARAYVERGHEVLVLTSRPDDAPTTDEIDGIRVVRLPTRWWSPRGLSFNYSLPNCLSLTAIRQLHSEINRFSPDVIHQNGQFFDLTLMTTVIARLRRIPRVLTIHSPLVHTDRLASLLISSVDRLVLRPFARLGRHKIFAVDRFTMELYQRRYGERGGTVGFIPAAIRTNAFGDGNPERVVERFRLQGKRVILSFGHVVPVRSRLPLVRALPRIIELVPSAHLLVVGQVYDWSFMRLAQSLGVAEHITIVGRVPHVDVPDYLAAADLETHDLDIHGLGLTTFEVMAAGVPIVANVRSDVFPGVNLSEWPLVRIRENLTAEGLADEVAGLLLAPGEERQQIIDQQRVFIEENFSIEKVADSYLGQFQLLVGAP